MKTIKTALRNPPTAPPTTEPVLGSLGSSTLDTLGTTTIVEPTVVVYGKPSAPAVIISVENTEINVDEISLSVTVTTSVAVGVSTGSCVGGSLLV